jgi:predicted CopG family antitoxin
MEANANTTITVDKEVRAKIESEKVHPRESVNDVLRRKYLLPVVI